MKNITILILTIALLVTGTILVTKCRHSKELPESPKTTQIDSLNHVLDSLGTVIQTLIEKDTVLPFYEKKTFEKNYSTHRQELRKRQLESKFVEDDSTIILLRALFVDHGVPNTLPFKTQKDDLDNYFK